MGTPEYAAVSLRRLLDSPHRVRAVVTRPDRPRGRGQKMEASAVKKVATGAGVEVLEPRSARDEAFLRRLDELGADLGVVVAYGRILPKAALDAPRLGCINAHASLLPKLRGAAPIERAVLEGLGRTGVTIMQMNEGLDEGDVLFAREAAIPDEMNGGQLREVLAQLSAQMVVDAADAFAAADAGDGPRPQPLAQNHDEATFAPALKRSESAIHWGEDARDLWLRVRAFSPRPGAFALDRGQRLKILDARPRDLDRTVAPGTLIENGPAIPDGGVRVACGRGALEVLVVQPEGKRRMQAADWARGLRLGDAPHVLDDGR